MKKYFRVEQGFVHEIIECDDIANMYHPDVKFIELTNQTGDLAIGKVYNEETLSFTDYVPPPPEPVSGPYPVIKGGILNGYNIKTGKPVDATP